MYRWLGIVFLVTAVFAKYEDLDGKALYKIAVDNIENVRALIDLETELNLDVWGHALPARPGYALVPRENRKYFENRLIAQNFQFNVETDNITELVQLEDNLLNDIRISRPLNFSKVSLPFDRIFTYDQIDAYIDLLGETYSNVEVVNAGNSFEGRPIKYIRISTTNFQDTSKPIVYIQSLLHAREWITQSATLYAIHKLVIDVTEHDLVNDIDWIIMPIVNPDGFVHTHETYRFWRKNRATGYLIGNICRGVDLNRNFDVMFGTNSSTAACSDTFHGASGFSEPESKIVGDIMNQYSDRLELFLDIHSFGSLVLYAFGNGVLPPNALMVHLAGVQMAQAIDAAKLEANPNYIVGNTALVLYGVSGSASDYAAHIGIPLSYTFEMPAYSPGSTNLNGFLVNPDFIEQAGVETWEGIKTGALFARNSYRERNGL